MYPDGKSRIPAAQRENEHAFRYHAENMDHFRGGVPHETLHSHEKAVHMAYKVPKCVDSLRRK